MIDNFTKQKIFDTAEIADVISEFVTLKKRGVNLIGFCPFHNEKSPSFTVSSAKGYFKCFGCGKGGNVVNFMMEHESLSYPEALRWLARKYNIEVYEKPETEEQKQLQDERESMMIISAYAQKYFTKYLWENDEGLTVGLSYLHDRGFRDEIIKKFELGYCPDGKDKFSREAIKNGYKPEYLEKTGLLIKRDDWMRDRFEDRIIFPIHNIAGRVIGFGGRTLKNENKIAKYINSPESGIYYKSKALYGLFQAKRQISKDDKCYLVEGYTDVLSFHQAGIENVVSSSGTALTHDQIRMIKRFSGNISIIFDGDEAGIKASLRGIDIVLQEGVNVKVILLPEGEDPDSFARSMSSSELKEYIKQNETDFIQFKTKLLLKNSGSDPVARSRLISDIVRSIAVIPNSITRSVYLKECSKIMDIREDVLYAEIRKIKQKQTTEIRKTALRDKPKANEINQNDKPAYSCEYEEREILRIMIKYFGDEIFEIIDDDGSKRSLTVGSYILNELENDELVSDNPLVNEILDHFRDQAANPTFKPERFFVNHSNINISRLASDLITEKYIESKRWKKGGAFVEAENEILDLIVPKIVQEYKIGKVKNMLRELEIKIQDATDSNQMEKVMDIQNQYLRLKKVENHLSIQLGNRTII